MPVYESLGYEKMGILILVIIHAESTKKNSNCLIGHLCFHYYVMLVKLL